MNWRIVDGRLEHEVEGRIHSLSASEIWTMRKSDFLFDDGIEILGYGTLSIRVSEVEGNNVEIYVASEGHEVNLPRHLFPLSDYVIVEQGFWIPLQLREIEIVNSLVVSHNLLSSEGLTGKNYVELLRLKHSRSIEVKVPSSALENITFSKELMERPNLKLTPYPYQLIGIDWLCSLFRESVGGILADQMGLGKTLQLIALTVHAVNSLSATDSPVLIIVPNSLKENWRSEFVKFAPSTHQPHLHTGTERDRSLSVLASKNVIITTYDILNRDIDLLREINWRLIICDEAQSLKNYKTQRRISVSSLKAECKFMATGTPVENNLQDLWSLMDLVQPGIMGDFRTFQSMFQSNPIDASTVGNAVKPLVLRRKTAEVLDDLPAQIRKDEIIEPTAEFAEYYEIIRRESESRESAVSHMEVLQTLRLYCCYPPLVIKELGSIYDAKAERLLEITDNISAQGDQKVIIFTGFHDSTDYLIKLMESQYPSALIIFLDGRIRDTVERMKLLQKFEEKEGFAVLIANPRVAGEGLNITTANHVIHFNLDWNPQKEDQASARVIRPGQKRTVFIHRMFYMETVEEHINLRSLEKRDVANAALLGAEGEAGEKSIKDALSMSPLVGYSSGPNQVIKFTDTKVQWAAAKIGDML